MLVSALACSVVLDVATKSVRADDQNSQFIYDTICGPRCARRVLEALGRNAELYELVDELQPRPLNDGCSLFDLAAAFERRGLFTQAVKVDRDTQFFARTPAIIHLDGPQLGGHYIVQLAGTDFDGTAVWLPEGSECRVPPGRLAALRSGAVLFVSETPLTAFDHISFRRLPGVGAPSWAAVGTTLLLVLAPIFYCVVKRSPWSLPKGR